MIDLIGFFLLQGTQVPIALGENRRLVIPSPGERSHDAIHWNPDAVAHVHPGEFQISEAPISMRLEDHSPFIQQLFLIWQQQSRHVPATQDIHLKS